MIKTRIIARKAARPLTESEINSATGAGNNANTVRKIRNDVLPDSDLF